MSSVGVTVGNSVFVGSDVSVGDGTIIWLGSKVLEERSKVSAGDCVSELVGTSVFKFVDDADVPSEHELRKNIDIRITVVIKRFFVIKLLCNSFIKYRPFK